MMSRRRCIFQSTLPTRGSDLENLHLVCALCISIHAPHEGERPCHHPESQTYQHFNPRSPRGGATGKPFVLLPWEIISIHAPHEGERPTAKPSQPQIQAFQSTLPTRGSDWFGDEVTPAQFQFQSTLPTRGSDLAAGSSSLSALHFNPRSPRGGATLCYFLLHQRAQDFNPRSPRGGATNANAGYLTAPVISIHAPHEGERPSAVAARTSLRGFQSTLPTRGSDDYMQRANSLNIYFNPRSPRGGATGDNSPRIIYAGISIHAPHEGERLTAKMREKGLTMISIHAPHEGERPLFCPFCLPRALISIHAPHEGERPQICPAQWA